MDGARDWRRTDGPGGAVVLEIRVPPGRRRGLAAWAVLSAAGLLLACAVVAALAVASALSPAGWSGWGTAAAIGFLLLVPRVPGAWRLARWRLAGRETVSIANGRLDVRRTPCSAGGAVTLDLADGACVGVVGDVDRFLVRATRWRVGRWFRRDDVPGLGVGSVRIATAAGSALVGLSLSQEDAQALADELRALPGFQRDREPVPAARTDGPAPGGAR